MKFISRVLLKHTNNVGCCAVFGAKHVKLDYRPRCVGSGQLVPPSPFCAAGQQRGSGQGQNFCEAKGRRQSWWVVSSISVKQDEEFLVWGLKKRWSLFLLVHLHSRHRKVVPYLVWIIHSWEMAQKLIFCVLACFLPLELSLTSVKEPLPIKKGSVVVLGDAERELQIVGYKSSRGIKKGQHLWENGKHAGLVMFCW